MPASQMYPMWNKGGAGCARIPNPFVKAGSLEEAFSGAGFEMEAPEEIEGFQGRRVSYIRGTLIQAAYGEEGSRLLIRKGTGKEDISGDYNVYEKEEEMTAGGRKVRVRADAEGIRTLTWTDDGYAFAITGSDPMTEEMAETLVCQIR